MNKSKLINAFLFFFIFSLKTKDYKLLIEKKDKKIFTIFSDVPLNQLNKIFDSFNFTPENNDNFLQQLVEKEDSNYLKLNITTKDVKNPLKKKFEINNLLFISNVNDEEKKNFKYSIEIDQNKKKRFLKKNLTL